MNAKKCHHGITHTSSVSIATMVLVAVMATGCSQGTDDGKTRDVDTPGSWSQSKEPTVEPATPTNDGMGTDPFIYGDDAALDALWDECAGGDPNACSDLFWDSPYDSDYEWFGATCGDTAEWGACASPPTAGPAPDGATGPGQGLGWWATAESACAEVYETRGRADHAQDYDDDMMLYYNWWSDVLSRAVNDLANIGTAPTDGAALIQEMSYLSQMFGEAALIYNEHPIFSETLDAINAETPGVQQSIQNRARNGGAPSCGALTVGDQG